MCGRFTREYGQKICSDVEFVVLARGFHAQQFKFPAPLSRKFSRDHPPPISHAKYILSKDSPELEFDAVYPICTSKPKREVPGTVFLCVAGNCSCSTFFLASLALSRACYLSAPYLAKPVRAAGAGFTDFDAALRSNNVFLGRKYEAL